MIERERERERHIKWVRKKGEEEGETKVKRYVS